ncbi:MAG: acyltransferase [Proteobacteria bacterium]|uniref:acyltransferase family protein n=1 Tax=Ottowia sp. TaxID=1898956 RepID=UPI0025D60201|nr:acyltransferase [Ottowia sp.]MBS0415726.1 acyltransferase [Pseudomonadota bacterium]
MARQAGERQPGGSGMSVASSSGAPTRNFGLDVLRSAAIAAVLAFHGYLGLYVSTGLSEWRGWRAALSACGAILGLEWFFVLSGFLIGSILIRNLETGRRWWPSTRDFWLRRWFRTLPNYYLFLAVNALLAWWQIEEGRFAWPFLVFSQSLAWPQQKPLFFSESWSLAVEEWFYFLIALLVGLLGWLLRLERRRLFGCVAGVLIVVPMALRIVATPATHFFEWDESFRRVTVMHLDSIGWGVAAAIANRWHPTWWARRRGLKALLGLFLTAAGMAAMFYFMLRDWHGFAGGRLNDLALMTAPALGTALLLPWLTTRSAPSPAVRRLVARAADHSYSMYLCHLPLMLLILAGIRYFAWDPGGGTGWIFALWLALVWALSALIFAYFEKPLTGLRDRFSRRVQAGPFDAPSASSSASSGAP